MLSLVFRRVLGFACALLLSSAAIFWLMEVLPGDPAQIILGMKALDADRLMAAIDIKEVADIK